MHRSKYLEKWKRSTIFCLAIYATTLSFPENEKLGLTNQTKRDELILELEVIIKMISKFYSSLKS